MNHRRHEAAPVAEHPAHPADAAAAERAHVFKALADPGRVRIIEVLAERGEASGSEIAERTGMSLALLCHHWDVLERAGLIRKWKEGSRTICALDRPALNAAVRGWLA